MAIPENQHCANCIDTLSFPIVVGFPARVSSALRSRADVVSRSVQRDLLTF